MPAAAALAAWRDWARGAPVPARRQLFQLARGGSAPQWCVAGRGCGRRRPRSWRPGGERRPRSAPGLRLRSRRRLVYLHCGVSAAPWWRVPTTVLLERMLASPWWRRWLRPCGGSLATPWWWVGDADRLFTVVTMRVKTHPSLRWHRWRHWRHFLPESDVMHRWLEPGSRLRPLLWASVFHVGCGG